MKDKKAETVEVEVTVQLVEVETLGDGEEHPLYEGETSSGPTLVNSRAYRMNHDRIFGNKTRGQA